ncbi:MAG: flavodoxin [Lachnospiraceae bacterium]|nr:flavodoxin [Lachnospiraceae bacterium]
MRKLTALIVTSVLAFSLAACGNSKSEMDTDTVELQSVQEPGQGDELQTAEDGQDTLANDMENKPIISYTEGGSDILVAVFSATGTTKGVAEKIAETEGADLYEIIPAEPYSEADLDQNDKSARAAAEQSDSSARPAIGSMMLDLSGYTKIYIGYPIWFGEEPRIMDTFVESYYFGDATVIPFCTSSESGIGNSAKNLAENAGSGNWIDGKGFNGDTSEDEIKAWIAECN